MPHSDRAEHGICEILRGTRAAGLGFTIDLTHVVTCAHVVNTALGRADRLDRTPPAGEEAISVRFPIGSTADGDARWTARVARWLPGTAGPFEVNDIAVLELTRPAPAHVPGLRPCQYRRGMSVQMWGPQKDRPDGGHVRGALLGEVRGGRIQVDVAGGPFRVRPGFSGGPVWDTSTGDVVGMVSACGAEQDAVDVYLLGTSHIAEAWPQWMRQDPAADPASRPGQNPAIRRRRRLRIAAAGSAAAAGLAAVAVIASMQTPSRGRPPGPGGTRHDGAAATGQTLHAATPGAPIAVGSRPFGIAITPDGKIAYVADNGGNTVTPVYLATRTPGHPITVGNQPYAIAVTPDGSAAYVTNSGDGTVTPISIRTGTAGPPIKVGRDPEWIAITPDGTTAYVANHQDGTVTPVNLGTGLPGAPIPAGNGPNRIAITRDGATAYVTDQNTSTITPISIPGNVPRLPDYRLDRPGRDRRHPGRHDRLHN